MQVLAVLAFDLWAPDRNGREKGASLGSQRNQPISISEQGEIFLFKGIAPERLIGLLADCPVICLEKGELLLTHGEANSKCYFIISGSLQIHVDSLDSTAVSTLYVGESVGEISLLDGEPVSAYVVCREACQVLVVEEEVLWSLVNSFHSFCRNMLLLMVRRLRSSNMSISESFKKQREHQLTANVDELTGLYNRRWLRDMLARQMKRSQGNAVFLSALMIDVDHFKRINDVHGHNVGDLVLRGLALTLMNGVRPTDMLARYGGEEFVVVLPGTDLGGARVVAGRLCGMVAEAKTITATGVLLPDVTISVGIAQMRDAETMDEFIARTDVALYQAKENGRNRVEG